MSLAERVTLVARVDRATSIFAVPSKDVPPIVLAVANAVVVADRAIAMFAVPSNEVPPMVRAVSKAVAVEALPVTAPVNGPAKASEVTVLSKKASLNSRLDVPKSISLFVTGTKAPSIIFN